MDPTRLISAIFNAKISQYVSVAGATLYFYDYFLTLGSEVELFWNSKGGWLLRLIVITIRYCPMLGFPIGLLSSSPLVSSLSASACRFSIIGGISFQVLCGVSATTIFCLRVCTLYESHPRIRSVVLAAFWISTAAQITVSAIAMSILHPRIGTIDGHCAVVSPPSQGQTYVIGAAYITAVPCEVVILVATICHALDARRFVFSTNVVWPILRRLYTDGAFWFAIALSLRLFGCFQWLFCPEDLKYFSDYMLYALQTIVAGRFFLSLRRHIGNSALSKANIVQITLRRKGAVGSGLETSTTYSSSPSANITQPVGVRRAADDRHILGLTTNTASASESVSAHVNSRSHSYSRRYHSWRFPSFNMTMTTQETHSTPLHSRSYPPTTTTGEEIQMTSVSSRDHELEATRSRSKAEEPTVQSTDAPSYDLEVCRTNSEPKTVPPNVGVAEPNAVGLM